MSGWALLVRYQVKNYFLTFKPVVYVYLADKRTLQLCFSCMKKLHDVVNIIPVIARADTMTIEERDAFKVCVKERETAKEKERDIDNDRGKGR